MEVKVRISAKAADEAAAMALITPVETEVRQRLGSTVFATDDDTVEQLVVDRLTAKRWTVATIEEATLGEAGSRLAKTAGGAAVHAATVVPGSTAKGLTPRADVTLEIGPIGADPTEGPRTTRPVEIKVHTPEATRQRVFEFGGDDERVRTFAAIAGLHLLRLALDDPES